MTRTLITANSKVRSNSVGVTSTFSGGNLGKYCGTLGFPKTAGPRSTVAFNRCHFGVKNGYNSGTDGYGIGETGILVQSAPFAVQRIGNGP